MSDIALDKIFFLDIETVTEYESYAHLRASDPALSEEWDRKSSFFKGDETPETWYENRAGIFSEFSKVICISIGAISFTKKEAPASKDNSNQPPSYQPISDRSIQLKIKSISHHKEVDILNELREILEKHRDYKLCAHNGKEFDFPFLARRYIIKGIKIPHLLNLQGKKPWETNLLDTMELWKFGDYKNYTSLNLLAKVLKITSPKSAMSGDKVHGEYHQRNNLKVISEYCDSDVIALVKVYLKLSQKFIELGNDDIIKVR